MTKSEDLEKAKKFYEQMRKILQNPSLEPVGTESPEQDKFPDKQTPVKQDTDERESFVTFGRPGTDEQESSFSFGGKNSEKSSDTREMKTAQSRPNRKTPILCRNLSTDQREQAIPSLGLRIDPKYPQNPNKGENVIQKTIDIRVLNNPNREENLIQRFHLNIIPGEDTKIGGNTSNWFKAPPPSPTK